MTAHSKTSIPLDPGVGGMTLIKSELKPGDVLVSTTSALTSKLINLATGSKVSHAMIYTGDGNIIEAIGDGVIKRTLTQAIAESYLCVAYRHKNMSKAQAQQIVQIVNKWVGKKYDYLGTLFTDSSNSVKLLKYSFCLINPAICSDLSNANSKTPPRDKFFCSELVLTAYKDAGMPLTKEDPSKGSPNQIVNASINGSIGYLGHIKY